MRMNAENINSDVDSLHTRTQRVSNIFAAYTKTSSVNRLIKICCVQCTMVELKDLKTPSPTQTIVLRRLSTVLYVGLSSKLPILKFY